MNDKDQPIRLGKPKWLRRRLPSGPQYEEIRTLLKNNCLTTVCQEAQCPNQFECYSKGTATFMILGEKCTRNCMFCAVEHASSASFGPPDPEEPLRVARAVKTMGLQYSVITSVTRDDLEDGGASLFAETVRLIRVNSPDTLVEILIPDLQGDKEALRTIVDSAPNVLNHNIETVPRLYERVRPEAMYHRSLELLATVKNIDARMVTKSGLMLGLGENHEEVLGVMDDLRAAGCDILTLGQYLQPSRNHLAVTEFIHPQSFAELKDIALAKGFAGVASGPSVRSSFEAGQLYRAVYPGGVDQKSTS